MPFRSVNHRLAGRAESEASRDRGTTAGLCHPTPEIRNTRSPESVNRDSWSTAATNPHFRPTDASDVAKRWFKSQISCVPPKKQPLALGAESTRFRAPQLQGQRNRRKIMHVYVKWNRFSPWFARERFRY